MRISSILPYALVLGGGYLGYEFVVKPKLAALQATTAATSKTTAIGTTNPATLGGGFVFPQQGAGIALPANCPAGMVLTPGGPLQFSDLRAQLVAGNYPGAATLDDATVLTAWSGKYGQYAIPC